MGKPQLNPKIIEILSNKTDLKTSTIRQNISKLKQSYPKCTLNAVAQIYARSIGFSVMQKLSKEDKDTIPHNEVVSPKVKIERKKVKNKEQIIKLIQYETQEYFIKGHIDEVNRAYTKGCYTSVFILVRKIIENLAIDILRKRFSEDNLKNKQLYYDITKKRYLDFGVIIKNLYNKRNQFGVEKSVIIERLNQKVKPFKKDANDKTHSWFHLVKNKTEIKNLEIQYIFELIIKIEDEEK